MCHRITIGLPSNQDIKITWCGLWPRRSCCRGLFTRRNKKNILPNDLELVQYVYHRKIIEANMVDVVDLIGGENFGSVESGSQQMSLNEGKYGWLKYLRKICISLSLFFISIIDEMLFKKRKGAELNTVIKKVPK